MPRPSLRHGFSRNPEFSKRPLDILSSGLFLFGGLVGWLSSRRAVSRDPEGFAVGFVVVFEFACHCGMMLAAIQKVFSRWPFFVIAVLYL